MSEATEEDAQGRIVTFYSYKGGTGRSMALANVAWILASNGLKVLVIDWDMEAPGLHRYLHPFIEDKDLSSTPGLIDYFVDLDTAARQAAAPDCPRNERWFEPYTVLLRYSKSIDFEFPGTGTLDFVCAGQQDRSYSERVTGFDWRGFYKTLGGGVVLQALKQRLRKDYHYVLIDSRTGISDTAGICTVQMPDDLVVLFTLNRQSIRGAAGASQSAFDQRKRPDGTPGLRIFPVRTRVERVEALRLRAAKDMAVAAFDGLLCHLSPEERQAYWGRVEIPYQPFYAHEEVLAPFADGEPESGSMLAAAQVIAGLLAGEKASAKPVLSEEQRKEYLVQYLPALAPKAVPPVRPVAPQAARPPEKTRAATESADTYKHWVYLSYARSDGDAYLWRFVQDLDALLLQKVPVPGRDIMFLGDPRIDPRESEMSLDALARCRTALCIYSPAYFKSESSQWEFGILSARAKRNAGALIAIDWIQSPDLREPYSSFKVSQPSMEEGIRYLVRRRSTGYPDLARELAQLIERAGNQAPLALELAVPARDS